MPHITTPKLAFPFRLDSRGGQAIYREQDSDEEIMDCVEVLLSTELGERVEVPDYGINPQEFSEGGASLEEIVEAIGTWEDRAAIGIERGDERLEELIDRLVINIKGRARA